MTPFGGALRIGDWKLVHNGHVPANATAPSERETRELFNVADDPGESQDVQDSHPEVFDRLKTKLAELAEAAVPANIPPNRAPRGFRVPAVWGESD